MDFQQLLAKMQELDQPAVESAPVVTDECGEMPPAPMGAMPTGMDKPDTPPPSMSVNLNAQGMDNIADLLKLVTKVNPEMEKPAMPPLPMISPEPKIMSIGPDMDADNDDKIGGEHDIEIKGKEEEAFGNSVVGSEPEVKGPEASIPDGNDLNNPKKMFAKAQDGDNAMSVESTDLRSQIRSELLRRLEEAKAK